jgi:hypothetical protein
MRQCKPEEAAFRNVLPVGGRQKGASRPRRYRLLRKLSGACRLRRTGQLLWKEFLLTRATGLLKIRE